jgi:starvation-inducible DNA-binding protein
MTKTALKTDLPKSSAPSTIRFSSPSTLSESSRTRLATTLNDRLADGIDLYTQLKVAHWNIKGPLFAAVHPLLDQYATEIAAYNDDVAERAVILGALASGTARHVARSSRLPEYPQETTRDVDHLRLLVERFDAYLEGLRTSRTIADQEGDLDTSDLLTTMVEETEKRGWFLRATLGT